MPGSVHGFHAALTTFVGRAGAVSEVASLLDQYRLVTVTGAGGAGKTRLAGEVAKRFTLLEAGDRLAEGRQRSLAPTVEWSYRLLDEREQRVFRAVSVFPGPFTLEAAEAVAGADTGSAVLHLVDCSLLVPPRAGPDGRSRYVMLETLRAYGAGLAKADESDAAAAALAGHALRVAEDAMAGMAAGTGEVAAARWLDAEEPIFAQGAGMGHGAR